MMDGQMDGWTDGQVDGWMDGSLNLDLISISGRCTCSWIKLSSMGLKEFYTNVS